MRLNAVKLLEIPITRSKKTTILEEIKKYLISVPISQKNSTNLAPKPLIILTPNPEQVIYARAHPWFAQLLQKADVTLPDGIGIIWASRILGVSNDLTRISGVDFLKNLVSYSAIWGVRIGLIGGTAGVAVKALECLKQTNSDLHGWAETGPEIVVDSKSQSVMFPESELYLRDLAERIKKERTGVLFIGLGAPKQEYFIEYFKKVWARSATAPLVIMAVGGSFDELSGKLPVAPQFIDSIGMKWLWRLVLEPWRWKRQVALIWFIYVVMYEHLRISVKK